MMNFLWFMWQMAKAYPVAVDQPVYFGRSDPNGAVDVVVLFARGRESNFVVQFASEFFERNHVHLEGSNE